MLGRSLDELPPQTRRLLTLIDGYVGAECQRQTLRRADVHFSRRSLREAIAWGDTQLKIHLSRLAELEYLVTHRTRTGGFEYELVYDMADGESALRFPGLADIDALRCTYDAARSGQNAARSASSRGVDGPRSVASRGQALAGEPISMRFSKDMPDPDSKTHCSPPNGKSRSYLPPVVVAPLAAAAN